MIKTLAFLALSLTAIACQPAGDDLPPATPPAPGAPIVVTAPPAAKPPTIACDYNDVPCFAVWNGYGLSVDLPRPNNGNLLINMDQKLQPGEFPSVWIGFPQQMVYALLTDEQDNTCEMIGDIEWTWPQGETGWSLAVDLHCPATDPTFPGAIFKATLTGNATR